MNKMFLRSRETVLTALKQTMSDEKELAVLTAAEQSATQKCNDNIVLYANFNGTTWGSSVNFSRVQITEEYVKSNRLPVIYIVLESPHVEEFKVHPPIPAAGKTGINVIQSLTLALNNHCPKEIATGDYAVALVNAIQFQTSLGVKPTYFRDGMFREMWSNGAKEAFITRLSGYLKDGDVLINGCTCGKANSKQMKLREDVQVAIDEMIKSTGVKITEIRTEHPSVWGRIYNTAAKYNTFADYSWKANSKLFKAYEG